MRELVTEAVVLGTRPHKENDRLIDFLTKDSGRVEALAVSGRKIASKLAPHCVFGSFVLARLVLKNRITIVDLLTVASLPEDLAFRSRAVLILKVIKALIPFGARDPRVWAEVSAIFRGKNSNLSFLLRLLGYDPLFAECGICGKGVPDFFGLSDHEFLCRGCAARFPKRETIRFI